MKKKWICGSWRFPESLKRVLMLMKIIVFIMMVSFTTISARTFSQTKLSLKLNDVKISKVLEEISSKTEFEFLYNDDEINTLGKVSINVHDANVNKILDICFKKRGIEYKIVDKVVLISPKLTASEQAKKITVKGKVVDEDNQPLPGVSVIVKGTTIGTSTDVKGKFVINCDKGDKLLFTFIGMQNNEVKVDGKEVLVKMKAKTSELGEVVVTGYQKIDKQKVASSVVTLKADKVLEGVPTSIDNMLQGKIAGLNVIGGTGTVGAVSKIRIRGISTISGSREPVWVVDGVIQRDPVPISASELNSLDNINLIGNAISFLNPEDIERIDVLKDASATAIYGSKAANGVIVITTKKGRKGKASVNYSSNFSFQERPSYENMRRMNSKQRIEVSKEIYERGLIYRNPPAPISYEGALYGYLANRITNDEFLDRVKTFEEQNTDWFDALFRTSFSHKHNVSISGADDKTNYYFSGSFNDSKGTFKYNDMKMYTFNMKLNSKITKNLQVDFNLKYSNSTKTYQHSSIDGFQYAFRTSRAIPLYNNDGSLAYYTPVQGHDVGLRRNILNDLNNSERQIKNKSFSAITNIIYDISDKLKFKALASISTNNTTQTEWFSDETFMASELRCLNKGDAEPTNAVSLGYWLNDQCFLPYGGEISHDIVDGSMYLGRADLSYIENINDSHDFIINIGSEVSSNQYKGVYTYQGGYLPHRGNQFVDIDLVKFVAYRERLEANKDRITDRIENFLSFYGTFTYAFENKYVVNFNIRADGSNKFGQSKDSKFLPIWSVSGRWNAHKENWFNNIDWINLLSFRGSYGVQGNVTDEQTPNMIVNVGGKDKYSGYYKSSIDMLPNPYLKWEKTYSTNFAFDYNLFNGRMRGNFDFYRKLSKDIFIPVDVAPSSGGKQMKINGGDMENKGIDFSLTVTPLRNKNWTWEIFVNGANNKNKILEAGSVDYTYRDYILGRRVVIGQPLETFYSYKFDGLSESGLPKYLNVDWKEWRGKGLTDQQKFDLAFEKSGCRVADLNGGFGTMLRYKGWTINANFSYSVGRKIRLNPLYQDRNQSMPRPNQNMDIDFVNRWKKPGDEERTDIPVLSNNTLFMLDPNAGADYLMLANNGWEMYNYSNHRVVSGDFIRLRNLSLLHRLPKSICKKFGFKRMDIRVEASNLLTIASKKLQGRDPEQISMTYNTGAIPLAKTYTLSLSMTF